MALPLTFGVEFEFALAYLSNDSPPLPHHDDTKKIIHLTPTEEDWETSLWDSSRDEYRARAIIFAAKRTIRNIIREAGFPVSDEKASLEQCDVSKWEVVEDGTIQGHERTPYQWTDIEVRSPALFFTRGSLEVVADMAMLLNKTFGIHVNRTTGLHVHIRDSTNGFDKITVSNLIAFLWAFEPQLNSLHPIYRQNHTWGQSMREVSTYAMECRKKYGRRPHPLTGVLHFLKGNSTYNLVRDAAPDNNGSANAFKYCAYSFQGIASKDLGFDDSKPTIEFRQHAATMDTEAVVNWIETSVGIVDYIRNIDNATLLDLLRIVEHENWEKLGDGKDDEREDRLGPILAESNFTIIDLLQAMELYGPANYYRNRWRKLPKRPPSLWNIPKPDIIWEYEDLFDPESGEYKRMQRFRESWELNRIASEAQPEGGWRFDLDHPSWPLHCNRGDPSYTHQLTTVNESDLERNLTGRASSGSDERQSVAGDGTSNASIPPDTQTFRSLGPLKFTSEVTEAELEVNSSLLSNDAFMPSLGQTSTSPDSSTIPEKTQGSEEGSACAWDDDGSTSNKNDASTDVERETPKPLRQLSRISPETEEILNSDLDTLTAASVPYPPKPPPLSPPFRTLSDLSFATADASSHPDAAELAALDAESATLDRELSAYEPLPGANIQTEDRLWRERLRYGRYSERDRVMYKGDGVLARGCRDPFDGRLSRKNGGEESPQVSPKSKSVMVKDEQDEEEGSYGARVFWGNPATANEEDRDGEMAVSPRTRTCGRGRE